MGSITCYLRDGDRVSLTYATTSRGNERVNGSVGAARHDALRPRRGVGGQPRGLARGVQLVLVLVLGRGRERHRPAAPCRSGPAPARPPWRPSAGMGRLRDLPSHPPAAECRSRPLPYLQPRTSRARAVTRQLLRVASSERTCTPLRLACPGSSNYYSVRVGLECHCVTVTIPLSAQGLSGFTSPTAFRAGALCLPDVSVLDAEFC
jgi:hypothetical protein